MKRTLFRALYCARVGYLLYLVKFDRWYDLLSGSVREVW